MDRNDSIPAHLREYLSPPHGASDGDAHTGLTEVQLREALRGLGIVSAADELNCGSCGFKTCLNFADALLAQNAARSACIVFRLKLAQHQANALLVKMPSAAAIVDEQLRIVECNANFARLFASGEEQPKEFAGTPLAEVIPFSYLFRRVLETGEEVRGHDIRYQRKILHARIFTIEPNALLGGIFQDITEPDFQREQIIVRAREVIQKNLKTVQQIAFLLGENAADSEIILNSIVRSFSPEEVEESSDDRRE